MVYNKQWQDEGKDLKKKQRKEFPDAYHLIVGKYTGYDRSYIQKLNKPRNCPNPSWHLLQRLFFFSFAMFFF